MTLIWADECTGDAGTPPDPHLWGLRLTEQWQSAAEQQNYTTSTANARYNGKGQLEIKAVKGASGGRAYSSARLEARRALAPARIRYGLVEARLQLPTGAGTWPAFWLLGDDGAYGWPWCGEVDVMEAPVMAGQTRQVHQGTHSPGAAGADIAAGVDPGVAADGWHTYSVDWAPDRLDFYTDHTRTGTVTRADVEAKGGTWVFNVRPMSPILNLAVGGWAGTPDPVWTSQTLLVDWVRVYG